MHTRDYVKSVFANEGLYKVKSAKMESFLKSIDDAPADCWPEFIAQFRDTQYELFDEVVPPLLFGKDRLVRMILVRAIDPEQNKEMALARRFVEGADGEQHALELRELAAKKNKKLNREILQKKSLPHTVLNQIDPKERLAVLAPKKKRTAKKRAKKSSTKEAATTKKTTKKRTAKKKARR